MQILLGGPGSGKTSVILKILNDHCSNGKINFTINGQSYTYNVEFLAHGEPDISPHYDVMTIESLEDMYDVIEKSTADVIFIDSLRFLAAMPGVLQSKGINRSMGEWLTFINLIGKKFGKAIVAVFNPMDDPDAKGGYYIICKSSVDTVVLLDDVQDSEFFRKIAPNVVSYGLSKGTVVTTSRFTNDRSDLVLCVEPGGAYNEYGNLLHFIFEDIINQLSTQPLSNLTEDYIKSLLKVRIVSNNAKNHSKTVYGSNIQTNVNTSVSNVQQVTSTSNQQQNISNPHNVNMGATVNSASSNSTAAQTSNVTVTTGNVSVTGASAMKQALNNNNGNATI